MNIKKTSIAAITLTIIFTFFIFFISLFHGITLYNIKIDNTFIKKLYIRIDKKLYISLEDIKIPPSNSKVDLEKIKKDIISTLKILKYFNHIEIKNLTTNDFKLNYFLLNNKKIVLTSNLLKFEGNFEYSSNKSYFNLNKLEIANNKIENIDMNVIFNPYITLHAHFIFKNNQINLNAILKENKLLFDLKSHLFNYNNIKVENLKAKGVIDLQKNILDISSFAKKIDININNQTISLINSNLDFNNNSLFATIEKINFPNKKIKDLKTSKIFVTFKEDKLFVTTSQITLNINDLLTDISNFKLIIFSKNHLKVIIPTIYINNQKISTTIKNIEIEKIDDKITYNIKNSNLKMNKIDIKAKTLIGDLIKASLKEIDGIVYTLPLKVKDILIDVKEKKITAKIATLNKVIAKNIIYKNDTLYLTSNTLFNKNLKEILIKLLNLNLPITQIKGENKISFSLNIKNLNSFTKVNTTNALFAIDKTKLFINKGEFNITNKKTIFNTNDSIFYTIVPIYFNSKGEIDYKSNSLNSKILIKKLNLFNLLKLTNFQDNLKIDFKHLIVNLQNANLKLLLKEKKAKITNLYPLLNFTPFKQWIKEGNMSVDFSSTPTIFTTITPTLNIFPNKELNLKIEASSPIKISNKNLAINIKEKNIYGLIKNTEVNLTDLTKLNSSKKTNNSKQTSSKSNYENEYNITLLTQNTNFIFKNHKLLSDKSKFKYHKEFEFNSVFKNSSIKAFSKHKYIMIEGNHFNKEILSSLANNNLSGLNDLDIDFVTIRTPDNLIFGKIFINSATIEQLTLLNNIVAFINTIPSFLSLEMPHYSAKGFKVKSGIVSFLLYKDILYIKRAFVDGENLSFSARGYINLKEQKLHLKVKANIKMKLKKIPIVGKGLSYLFFGKDGNIDIKMIVKGDIKNPKVKKDLGKEIIMLPIHLFRRALTLPLHIF